ncbi:unnamed protein product [Euphydryas editha]|uniref:DUF4817 domain-containing protein n=1 Tax=Euphydryas editha TaxID=104508 RepID=A0AAU9UJB7_EUPED|nr:unnamed protein product [Euphydryas editha]
MPRIQYTPQEYANMHFIYGECRGNANADAALYRERYPNLCHPDYRVFIRVHGCFSEGRIPGSGVGGASAGRPVISNDEEIVLDEIERDSSVSTRTLARHTGISKSRIQRIFKKNVSPLPFHTRANFTTERLQHKIVFLPTNACENRRRSTILQQYFVDRRIIF